MCVDCERADRSVTSIRQSGMDAERAARRTGANPVRIQRLAPCRRFARCGGRGRAPAYGTAVWRDTGWTSILTGRKEHAVDRASGRAARAALTAGATLTAMFAGSAIRDGVARSGSETEGRGAGIDRAAFGVRFAASRNAGCAAFAVQASIDRADVGSLAVLSRFGADRIDAGVNMSDVAVAKIETAAIGIGRATGGGRRGAGRYAPFRQHRGYLRCSNHHRRWCIDACSLGADVAGAQQFPLQNNLTVGQQSSRHNTRLATGVITTLTMRGIARGTLSLQHAGPHWKRARTYACCAHSRFDCRAFGTGVGVVGRRAASAVCWATPVAANPPRPSSPLSTERRDRPLAS